MPRQRKREGVPEVMALMGEALLHIMKLGMFDQQWKASCLREDE